ncbi:MAG TPA: hypothetical protein VLJ88_09325, partial [Propionibacteriaceae bacterium]|nr:hypothetical protein [Propionibacteriaceae bacterium]
MDDCGVCAAALGERTRPSLRNNSILKQIIQGSQEDSVQTESNAAIAGGLFDAVLSSEHGPEMAHQSPWWQAARVS